MKCVRLQPDALASVQRPPHRRVAAARIGRRRRDANEPGLAVGLARRGEAVLGEQVRERSGRARRTAHAHHLAFAGRWASRTAPAASRGRVPCRAGASRGRRATARSRRRRRGTGRSRSAARCPRSRRPSTRSPGRRRCARCRTSDPRRRSSRSSAPGAARRRSASPRPSPTRARDRTRRRARRRESASGAGRDDRCGRDAASRSVLCDVNANALARPCTGWPAYGLRFAADGRRWRRSAERRYRDLRRWRAPVEFPRAWPYN